MFGYTDVEPSQLKQLLTDQEVLLVDVRTPTESARACIPGARNIPLRLLPLRKQDLAGDRTIVFYCQSGNRSAQACAFRCAPGRAKRWRVVPGSRASRGVEPLWAGGVCRTAGRPGPAEQINAPCPRTREGLGCPVAFIEGRRTRMVGQGWRNVCNLRGGIVGWVQHGQPVAATAN